MLKKFREREDVTKSPGFCDLSKEEINLIYGGEDQDIVVNGYYWDYNWNWDWWNNSYAWSDPYYGGADMWDTTPPPADSDSHDVDVNITRPLTAEEQKAVNDLLAFVSKITAAINALPDNYILNLKEGAVKASEVKSVWANVDYVINEIGTRYANQTSRGEANYNGGNPVISFNIDLLVDYSKSQGGIEFVAFHDFAHLLKVAQDYDYKVTRDADGLTKAEEEAREQMANTIARALNLATNQPVLSNPEYGYDSGNPTFQSPPAPKGDRPTWPGGRR